MNRFVAALVCVERRCRKSPPTQCCITCPSRCMFLIQTFVHLAEEDGCEVVSE